MVCFFFNPEEVSKMAETVKGLSIKLGLYGRDLESELKEIQSEIKEQKKDLEGINVNLK